MASVTYSRLIEKLTENNYFLWKDSMESVLVMRKLWKYVNIPVVVSADGAINPVVFDDKSADYHYEALHEIKLNMSNATKHIVKKCATGPRLLELRQAGPHRLQVPSGQDDGRRQAVRLLRQARPR
jgi:hypothetical protein